MNNICVCEFVLVSDSQLGVCVCVFELYMYAGLLTQ